MSLLKSLFSGDQEKNLNKGLEATRKSFFSKLGTAIAGKSTVDVALLDDLEEVLVTADVGVTTTLKIIDAIECLCRFHKSCRQCLNLFHRLLEKVWKRCHPFYRFIQKAKTSSVF